MAGVSNLFTQEFYRAAKAKLAAGGIQVRDYSGAATVFEQLLKACPTSSTHWTNLAISFQALRQRTKADEAFKKALALDPANEYAKQNYDAFKRE